MTVLIVEDNSGMRSLLRRALAGTASQIWECTDGAEALEAYTKHRPDVVLMDMRMPQMDGLRASRLILQTYPSARIVIVSDYDDEDLRLAATAAGAYGYTLKQDLADLIDLLQALPS